jgi:cyclophilin family peptidyl-prolyl cis-trans isomerase
MALAAILLAPVAVFAAETETPQPASAAKDAAMDTMRAKIQELKDAGKIDTTSERWRTKLPEFPEVTFDKDHKYVWNLETSVGDVKVRLFPEIAPNHAANFIYLTELGFFDGLTFHRVIPEFMAQGGCPNGDGRGSPGYRFDGEFSDKVKHDRGGLLSMANAGPGTDGSQFFLTFVATPWLDGKHTIFGEVATGQSTLKELEKRGSRSGKTSEKITIEKASITIETK